MLEKNIHNFFHYDFDQVSHSYFQFFYIDIMRISNDKLYGLLDGMLDGNYSSKNFYKPFDT
jgi:hypothetical protein